MQGAACRGVPWLGLRAQEGRRVGGLGAGLGAPCVQARWFDPPVGLSWHGLGMAAPRARRAVKSRGEPRPRESRSQEEPKPQEAGLGGELWRLVGGTWRAAVQEARSEDDGHRLVEGKG